MNKHRFLTISIFSLLLSACNLGGGNSHYHMFNAWAHDKNYHWKTCAYANCHETSERGEHVFEEKTELLPDKTFTFATIEYQCSVCRYNTIVNIAFPDDWQHDDKTHYKYSIAEDYKDYKLEYAHEFGDWEYSADKTHQEKICSVCGHVITRTLADLGTEVLHFELNEDEESYYVADVKTYIDGPVAIPETYNGKPVTKIGKKAFQYCSDMSKITIPSCIKTIGDYAFSNCKHLYAIEFDGFDEDHRLESIGEYAFEYCYCLRSFDLSYVDYVGRRAFSDVAYFKIDKHHIYDYDTEAFSFDSVTLVEDEKGEEYYNYEMFSYSDYSGADILLIRDDFLVAHQRDVISYNPDGTTTYSDWYTVLVAYLGDDFANFHIPEKIGGYEINIIANSFMQFNYYINTVNIPRYVDTIEDSAFYACGISNLIFEPNNVEYLKIGSCAFDGNCLSELNLPSNTYTIGGAAFADNDFLTSVVIPDKVATIDGGAFEKCYKLQSVKLGKSVKNISYSPFTVCPELRTITVDPQNRYFAVENNTLYDIEKRTLICCAARNTGIFTIPETVKTVGQNAFSRCYFLSKIIIPETVKTIESFALEFSYDIKYQVYREYMALRYNEYGDAFYLGSNENPYLWLIRVNTERAFISDIHPDCQHIYYSAFYESYFETIEVPEGVVTIYELAFYGSPFLTTVYLPSTLESITYDCFEECPLISEIYFNGTQSRWTYIIDNSSDWSGEWSLLPPITIHCTDGDIKSGNRNSD